MSKKHELIFQAIQNEISIDNYLYDKIGCKKNSLVFKVLRFSDRIDKNLYILFLFLIPFYFLFFSIKQFFLIKKRKRVRVESGVFLAFSRSPKNENIRENYFSHKQFILCVDGRSLEFVSNLGFLNVIKNFCISLFFYFTMAGRVESKYILHFTSILELCLFFDFLFFLKKNGVKDLYISNHYDRWATLIGNVGFFDVHLVQHGLVSDKLYIKNKIKNVSELKCFNTVQKKIFLNNILNDTPIIVEEIGCKLEIIIDDVCDFLIISSPFYIDEELEIYNELKQKFITFFRPHPLFINDEIVRVVDVADLCLDKRLPNPKICICRDSTLGAEYESMGYIVFWWNDESDFNNLILNIR